MDQLPNQSSTSERAPPRVLIVAPERRYLAVLARRISDAGYRVACADSVQAALAEMHRIPPDVLVAELAMRGASGVELVRIIREDAVHPDLPLILIGGRSEAVAAVRALHAGADDVVRKPFDFDILIARIARQIERADAIKHLRHANATLDARVVTRAIAVGELREQLQASEAERLRLESLVRRSA
jgi:DNA-binding response OmpR family regulator